MKQAQVIVSYDFFKELETQNKAMIDLLLKLLNENDIQEIKTIISEFNDKTKYLWL